MKKSLIYAILLLLATGAEAQDALTLAVQRVQAAASSPSMGELRKAIQDFQEEQAKAYGAGPQWLTLHKTDSVDTRVWDADLANWGPISHKGYYTYDCNIEKRLTYLSRSFNGSEFENTYKAEHTYYPDGQEQSLETFLLAGPDDWVKSFGVYSLPNGQTSELLLYYAFSGSTPLDGIRIVFQYDAQDRILLQEEYAYDSNLADWVLAKHITWTYDAQGLLLQVLESSIETGTWEDLRQWLFSYDGSGRLTQKLIQSKELSSNWTDQTRYSYAYGAGDLPSEMLKEEYLVSEWVPKNRWNYTYDAADLLTEELVEQYAGANWQSDSLKTTSYDGNDQAIERNTAIWDPTPGAWVNFASDIMDAEGKVLVTFSKNEYDASTNTFGTGSRTINAWHLSEVETSQFDALESNTLDDWRPIYFETNTFDAGDVPLQRITQLWDIVTSGYAPQERFDFHNSSCLVGASGEASQDRPPLCTFANPLERGQKIVCDALPADGLGCVELYDLAGRLAWRQAVSGQAFRLADEIHPGLYLMVIRSGANLAQYSKLVVR